jgi:hypothetical protein
MTKFILGILFVFSFKGVAQAQILWSGDFSTGNFKQWHMTGNTNEVAFFQIPSYGRPIQYGFQNIIHIGDGSLLSLVSSDGRTVNGINYPRGPTRGGAYAAKVTVKNSVNGTEANDCDGSICTRRRTELTVQATLPRDYNAMPYMTERWLSVSHFVPADWDDGGSGWGPTVFQVKPLVESGSSGLSPAIGISISEGAWRIEHRWSPIENPTADQIPWQQAMFYAGSYDGRPYPRSDFWPEGLRDYPNTEASQRALMNLNKGGWTDWIIQVRYDARGVGNGGTGFLTVWKRENLNPWVKVLHVLPKVTTRGGMTFDHGIGYNSPAGSTHPGGFGIKAGMYMEKSQVWGLSRDRVIYNANIKVGGANTTFAQMVPALTDTGGPTSLAAPRNLRVN